MLFDLRGRRRRAVQATYLTLAVLMGGGLVFFGIGGDVSGGLFDAFSDRSGGDGNGNSQLEQRIERNEKRLGSPATEEPALKALVRDYYALAIAGQETGTTTVPEEGRDELRKAAAFWRRYVDTAETPDPSLARVALAIFDPGALNQPKDAQKAMEIVAADQNTYEAYLALVARAALAGDTRTANLAAQKAVDLAPKELKKQVKKQAEQLKKPVPQQQ
jgi:hypothetical protein